ncbi:MAG: hypothetical protein V4484_10560 [Pseudomonadota bacterium]
MNDIFEIERERLLARLQEAAANLLAHTRTQSMIAPLNDDGAPRYLVIGGTLELQRLCGIISRSWPEDCVAC